MDDPKDKKYTRPGAQFTFNLVSIGRFDRFLKQVVHHVDYVSNSARTVLRDVLPEDEAKELEDKPGISACEKFQANRQLYLEMMLVRHVENFLNYFSSLLYEIFTHRPETLRSSDKVELSAVLKHPTIESFIREAAERKTEIASYGSFQDLLELFADRFGLTLGEEELIQTTLEAIEIRNISVHNRCIINRRFLSRTGRDPADLGKTLVLEPAYVEALYFVLFAIVDRFEDQAIAKFGLQTISLESLPKSIGTVGPRYSPQNNPCPCCGGAPTAHDAQKE
ncbi:MAG TPA: hypothetical protein VEH27_15810 [Methylomirabilota bacterium]|nr:hypothetical protein [Methylomirabilota bacterium]